MPTPKSKPPKKWGLSLQIATAKREEEKKNAAKKAAAQAAAAKKAKAKNSFIEPNKEVTYGKPALDHKSRAAGSNDAINANPYAKKPNTVLPEVVITGKKKTEVGAREKKQNQGQGSSAKNQDGTIKSKTTTSVKKKSGTKTYADLDPAIKDKARAWNMDTYGTHNPTADAKKAGISKAELAKRHKAKTVTPRSDETPMKPRVVKSVPSPAPKPTLKEKKTTTTTAKKATPKAKISPSGGSGMGAVSKVQKIIADLKPVSKKPVDRRSKRAVRKADRIKKRVTKLQNKLK
tara:strand:+ start:19564 stop:20433 length:870 start_codon:yes stop_codon:yes gene_type:complete